MIRRHAARRPARRGAILLIVLTMLALFAVIGLSFVLYSESEATAARIHKDRLSTPSDDLPPDPNAVAGTFLGQLIYPVPDAGDATLSGLRGHELARLMYGFRDGSPNDVAYNGVGMFSEVPAPAVPGITNRTEVVNFSYRPGSPLFDPEHTGYRQDNTPAAGTPAAGQALSGAFVGKNAGYTYPDRNNMAVAVANPNTGEVIVPSFLRRRMFNTTQANLDLRIAPPGTNGVAAASDDWLIPNGRYKIIRPRPADHSADFPYPPMNPDGTYTGDVQNLIYASGRQKNDSIWIDANLPVVRWRGKNIKPLIAPLVLPLDGRVNLNVAGNLKNAGTAHGSGMGFGAWEIDPTTILGGVPNLTTVVNARFNGATTPPPPAGSTLAAKLFQPDATNFTDPTKQTPPADYAKIDFDGALPPGPPPPDGPLTLPTLMNAQPTYPARFQSADAGEVTNHPSLWNPFQWPQFPTAPGARQFPFGDLRQTAGRYSDRAGKYGAPVLGQGAFANIFGSGAGSGPFVPTAAGDPNRIAAVRRALATTISNSVSRPGFAPNFGMQATPPTLDLAAGSVGPPVLAVGGVPTLPQFDATAAGAAAWGVTGAWGSDAAANVGRSVRAAFGAVDLNRPLVDYRDPTTRPAAIAAATPWPLNATTVTAAQYDLARADRQAFARDIFNRLVIATGAAATIDATTGVMTLDPAVIAGTPQFNALRWLAQLAANIVDQIDADDVSTVFVWRPTTPGAPLAELNDAANYAAGQVNDRVVFGVEKPRLVINETYAEIANAQADAAADPATAKFEVRFFVELLNPGADITDPANPLYFDQTAPGAAPLRYTAPAPISCYKLQIYRDGDTVRTDLGTPGNVLGVPPATSLAELKCDVDFTNNIVAPGAGAALADRVEANNGQFQAGAAAARNGFCVVGPELSQAAADKDAIMFVPNVAAEPFNKMIQKQATAPAGQRMFYTDVAPAPTAAVAPAWPTTLAQLTANVLPYLNTRKHAVLLQRLACPYQPAGPTNPYITVDYTSRVEVHDAVNATTDMPAPSRPVKPMTHMAWSVARSQPMTGDEGAPATLMTDALTTTLTRRTETLPAPAAGSPPQHSFFRHNSQMAAVPAGSDANLVLPFEWFPHFDRKLVNPVELLHTATVPPHLLTHRFAIPQAPAPTPPAFHRHDLQHAPVGADPAGALFTANSPAYRLFDGLAVKPWGHALPLGGRVPGKVNINMLWDQDPATGRSAVFDALFLAGNPAAVPPGNRFTAADLTAIWNALKATRSPSGTFPTVGTTVHEDAAGTDRPFRTPGSPVFAAGGSLIAATDIQDTIFRNRNAADPDTVTRSLFQRLPDPTNLHPYQSWEPLRKAFNNLTTTTDCYLVVFTIGYFEVKNNPPYGLGNPTQLGREVFNTVPGDMRAKYVGVVDRTVLGVDNGGGSFPGTPWFSELAETAPAGATTLKFPASPGSVAGQVTVFADGVATPVGPGTVLRLGTGDAANGGDGEWVTLAGAPAIAFDPATGLATVTTTAATTRPHAAGSPVGNIYLKNPGPQPAFNPFDPKSKGVLPFFAKVEPHLP